VTVTIGLLGEVSAEVDRRPVDLGPARQRGVLAALAVDAGRLVPTDRLVERLWGTGTPRQVRAALRSHISRLRTAFAGELIIVYRSGGYTLVTDCPEQTVDLLRFRELCGRARSAGDDERRVTLLTEALALWRGEPLTGVSGAWVDAERDRWSQERLSAEHDLTDARLRTGHGAELVGQLSARSERHPLDERVAGQYMLALHRAGRSADALGHYRRLRERLVTELGTDPGAALQDLHRQILAADPDLMVTVPGTPAPPRQLPVAPAWFVGRHDELDRLDTAKEPSSEGGRIVLVLSIGGVGGIGKTWLALRWAHRNLHRFPDGQLFVDLRGFSPGGRPALAVDVLGRFLDALGVGRDQQPADMDRRAELYRSLVADKRMLVVLDNAATSDQVTPLLPGGRHCTVVVTSRKQLRGLIARHGARPVQLDVLSDTDARVLLDTTLGADRTATDERAVAELIAWCGGFPLALGLIAARAAADPRLPLGEAAADLRALGVDALDSDEPTASLPAVLSWSLDHLTEPQRRAFALLGIAPGPDIGLAAATHLTGLPERETHAVLRALIEASLVDRSPGGRYSMHDLVRSYAAGVADDLPAEVRETALHRVLDFYTHTAHAAERLLYAHRGPAQLDPPGLGVSPQPLPDGQAALAWFDTEHACLIAAQHVAGAHGWHSTVWWLAWTVDTYLFRRGQRHDRLAVWLAAAGAAAALGDVPARTNAHRSLGRCLADLGSHEEAVEHLHQALALAEQQPDLTQQAHTHHALARAWELHGDDRRALEHTRLALDIHRGLDQPVWEADALNGVGWFSARLGDFDAAREHCRAALDLHRAHGNLDGQANTLDSLGFIDHESGRHRQAVGHYRDALTLYRRIGNTYQVADTLDRLGDPLTALGDPDQARAVWQEALELYEDQGRRDNAARVRQHLAALN
jgi:DNA-binding SARP family transcriptional activator/tetratricopeptide (TPR) repeat protein